MRKSKDVKNLTKGKRLAMAAFVLAAGFAAAVGMDAAGVLPMAYVQADADGQDYADDDIKHQGEWYYRLFEGEDGKTEAEIVGYMGDVESIANMRQADVPDRLETGSVYVTKIAANIFNYNGVDNRSKVEYVVLPQGVREIEANAFRDCTKLQYVKMPTDLKLIGMNAFEGCISLPWIKYKNEYTESGDCPGISLPTEAEIEIQDYAFRNCTGLERINLPDSVKNLGNGIFEGCTKLEYAVMPKQIDYIGDRGIFTNCTGLTSVTLPKNIDKVAGFKNCSSLKSLVIPEGATEIGSECFLDCKALESLVIPNTVTKFGLHCILYQTNMTVYAEPDSEAFVYAENDGMNFYGKVVPVKSATSAVKTDENGYKYMVHDAGDNSWAEIVGYVGDSVELEVPGAYYKKGEFEIPELTYNVKYIAGRSFMNKAITALTLPSSIEEIGEDAFSGCSKLESAVIDSNLDIIGDGAFKDCTSLTSIVFPFAITKIGNNAFSGCTSLTEATFATRDYFYTPTLEIGYNAFADCDLRSITLPKGITDISEGMFKNNTRLASVSIPDSVTYISDKAFYFCNELAAVTIPDKVTYIGDWAFASCLKIKEIRIPIYNTISIGANAFNNCQSLEKAFIYKNAEKIANSAFKYCDKLTIYTQSACAAVTFAENNNIPYVLVDNAKPAEPTTPEPVTPAPTENQSSSSGNGQQTGAGNTGVTDSGATTETAKVVVPTVDKVSGFKAARKKGTNIKCTWKKVKGAAGYQLQYSKSKKFKGFSLMKLSKKKKAMTISKLKKGTTYYVRVRAYKTYKDESGKTKTVYGSWTTKKVK